MITYGIKKGLVGGIPVRLDNKVVGEILSVEGGFQYFSKGSKTGGDVYPTLALCKKSLES